MKGTFTWNPGQVVHAGGSGADPLPPLCLKLIIPPCHGVGGCPGDPSPPLAGTDPPYHFRVGMDIYCPTETSCKIVKDPVCNIAYIPKMDGGVSGIPPPHFAFQIDHTPPPPYRGGIPDTPHRKWNNREMIRCLPFSRPSLSVGNSENGKTDLGPGGEGGIQQTPPPSLFPDGAPYLQESYCQFRPDDTTSIRTPNRQRLTSTPSTSE
jgi:hypothetical protein